MDRGNLEEARAAFERALEINPEFGWVKHTLLPSLEEMEAGERN
jgi:tetratricopeptide (TPR) repeat protein